MGVTEQEAAISATVNRRLSYLRCALLINAGSSTATGAGDGQAGHGAFFDEGGFVLGHKGKHAEDELAVGGGGDANAAGFENSDDIDQVAQAAADPVSLDDQRVAGAQVVQACLPLRAVGLGAGGDVLVDLQAAFGGEGVEPRLRILVGGADAGVPDLAVGDPDARSGALRLVDPARDQRVDRQVRSLIRSTTAVVRVGRSDLNGNAVRRAVSSGGSARRGAFRVGLGLDRLRRDGGRKRRDAALRALWSARSAAGRGRAAVSVLPGQRR